MAHSIVVAEQIIKFLELINEPNKNKDFLNELKSTAGVSKALEEKQEALKQLRR